MNKYLIITAILLYMTIFFSGPLRGEETKKLTLEEIINITLKNNPGLKAAEEKLAGWEAFSDTGGRWPNPELSAGPSFGTIESEENIVLSQVFPINGSSYFTGKKIEFEAMYIKAITKEMYLDILLEAKLKYYNYCKRVRQHLFIKENTAIYRKTLEQARLRYDAGDIPQAEVLRLELELSKAEQALIEAENQVKLSRSSLFAVMGIKPSKEIEFLSIDGEEKKLYIPDFSPEELVNTAYENRPLIEGQKILIKAMEYDIKKVKSERFPELVISYRSDFVNEGPALHGAEMRFEFPLWDYGTISGEINMAEASKKEEEALLEKIKTDIRLEVETAYYELGESYYLLKSFREKILINSDDLLWKAQFGYEEGALSYIEFIDAMKTYNEIKIEYIEALYSYCSAIAEFERAMGNDQKYNNF